MDTRTLGRFAATLLLMGLLLTGCVVSPLERAEPTETPAAATATPTETETPFPTATATPTETETPSPTATATPTETHTPTPTATASPTPSAHVRPAPPPPSEAAARDGVPANPPPSDAGASSALLEALAFIPLDAEGAYNYLTFTDWRLIKQYEGAEDLTSASNVDEKVAFLNTLVRNQASFGSLQFIGQGHAEVWGWDTTDLLWEASTPLGPPLHVLKFPGGFDFSPIIARFEERGFERSEYLGIPIYSHPVDLQAKWLISNFAILNTAVLQEEQMLILSSRLEGVQAALEAYRQPEVYSLSSVAAVRQTAQHLGTIASAYIGRADCSLFAIRSDAGNAFLDHDDLHAFEVLGLGYRYEGGRPLGLIVMQYDDPTLAEADLAARLDIAENGVSLITGRPLSKVFFGLEDGSVEGGALILRVRPVNNLPSRLVSMLVQRDLPFATC